MNIDRADHGDQNSGLKLVPAAGPSKRSSALASLAAPSAPIPASVAELARSLKYDPVLIYEFIHNNIEYLPRWGVLKGSVNTLIDGAGTAFDIAQLTADLINTNPAPGTSATLVRGSITVPDSAAASWIALNGMNLCPLSSTFASGGIPTSANYTTCAGGGTLTIGHVWVKVVIGGMTYEIDPSFKAHNVVSPSVDLAAATGYTRSAYLAAACSGCNTDPKVVTTLNRASILNPTNAQSLPTYAKNLLAYLKTNNIHDLSQVIGGHAIAQTYHTTLPTLPYTVASRVADPFTIDGTWKPALLVNFNGISQLMSSDAIYGKRLSVTFNGSNLPQLNLDGTIIQTGTTAVAPGASATVNLSMCLPLTGINCSVATVDGSGKALWCANPGPIYCSQVNLISGGIYVITNSWGPVSHNMVMRHRRASVEAANAGIPLASEASLGEALTTQGLSYSEQSDIYRDISEDGIRNGGYSYYIVGISGHSGSAGGPYLDMPGVIVFPGVVTTLNGDGSYTPATRSDNLRDTFIHGSVLESTTVNQIAQIPAVSTVKLLDIGMSASVNNSVFDLRNCADYTTYSPSLVAYPPSLLVTTQDLVCNKDFRVILPQRGDLSDPAITTSPKWIGTGYFTIPNTATIGFGAIIYGGYSGGFSAAPQLGYDTSFFANESGGGEILVTARTPNANISSILDRYVLSPVVSAIRSLPGIVSDPVDQASGAFLAAKQDIYLGDERLRSTELVRVYTTSDILPASPFGQGWKSSFDISAKTSSDGVRPTGMYDAWDAAEVLAVKFVNRDLLSDPALPVLNIAVASVGYRWIGDRLINNIVTVSTGTSATNFQRLADGLYNPAQHSVARLGGTSSAWIVTGADGSQMAFGTPDASGLARVDTVTQPNGVKTSFSYTSGQLTRVTNNLGRRLNLAWTGSHITGVTDTPLLGAPSRAVTYTYTGNLLQQVTDVRGGRTLYCYDANNRMTRYYLPTQGSGTNCAAAGANIVNTYDTLGRVSQQVDGGAHVTDLYLAGTRAEWVTHPGSGVPDVRSIRYLDNFGNTIRDISPRTGLATNYRFDAISRLVRSDLPEGNAVEVTYDLRSNPTRTCSIPKTAGSYPACNTSGSSTHIWTTSAYNEGAVWNCAAPNTCNKPQSVTDALGNVTQFTYNGDGTPATITSPTPSGAAGAPKTIFTYTPIASNSGNINLLTRTQVTSTTGSPSINTDYGYDTAANGLVLKTVTLDATGLNYVTTFGYDGYGNQTTVDGPRTDVVDVTTTAYDAGRNPVTITYPNPGSGSPVTQIAYNGDGRTTSIARKLGGSWLVSCSTYTASGHLNTAFGPWKTATPTDCSFSGNAAVPLTSYGYDGADRLIMTTLAEPTGNRITQLGLFADDRVQSVTRAFGTAVAATETTAYSNNGFPVTVTDARGNITSLQYDGFDRLSLQKYPLAAGGGPSATDVVGFEYDKRDALLRRSIRGNSDASFSCTQCIKFTYDQLGRLSQKTVPTIAVNGAVVPAVAAVTGYNVYYGYDLISRMTSVGYTSATPELTFAYDNASRPTSATQYGRTIGYAYGTPAQGLARTLSWPSAAGTMLTCTDALSRVSQIKEAADCSTTTGRLVAYGYDDLSRRISIARPNGATSSYTYEDTGALDTIGHTLSGTGSVNYAFGYNRALQITSRSTDNDLYAWANNYNVNRAYAANGLDQYGRIAGDVAVWDTRGNLLAYRGSSYGYDGENRLAAVGMPSGTVTTAYDPIGRLLQTGAATSIQFLYDGSAPIAEYNASGGALLGRYVPGAGTDETVVAYDGAGTKSWYHADAQGSIVAASDASGAAAVINQYGPFGEPGLVYAGRNAGRIRYTGQAYLPEIGLYNYKARIYAPKLGRFLQVDPIGASDDRNLYAYVGNDPINRGDPSGLAADSIGNFLNRPVPGLYTQTSPYFSSPITVRPETVGGLASELLGAVGVVRPIGAAANGTTALFRAVSSEELGSIQALNAFSNPVGIESKYFSTTLEGAQSYANQARASFGDPPYSFVSTRFPTGSITPGMITTVDRGGIPTIIIPTQQLPSLSTPIIISP